jgi:hypothetical protein
MSRTLGLALVLGVVWSNGSAAPKVADKTKAPLYFPTVVGERWVLSITGGDKERVTNCEEVVGVAEKGGVTTVTVARLKPDGTRMDEYTVEASVEGVCVVAAGAKKYERPTWLIKNPTKPGSKWEYTASDGGGGKATYVYTVVGEETVETPAGTFKAVRVDCASPTGAEHSEWFAPGRGRIQQVSDGCTVQLTSVTNDKKR